MRIIINLSERCTIEDAEEIRNEIKEEYEEEFPEMESFEIEE